MESVLLRAALLCGMFAVLSYADVRTRLLDDRVILLFGAAGAAAYLQDWQEYDLQHVALCLIGAALGGFLACRYGLLGGGDAVAFVAATAVMPLYGGVPVMVPLIMAGFMLMGACGVLFAVSCNVADLLRGALFCGVCDGPFRKAAAFFMLHRQRDRPRHVFVAQKECGNLTRLILRHSNLDADYASREGVGRCYVAWAMPVMPFMLAASIALLAHLI